MAIYKCRIQEHVPLFDGRNKFQRVEFERSKFLELVKSSQSLLLDHQDHSTGRRHLVSKPRSLRECFAMEQHELQFRAATWTLALRL